MTFKYILEDLQKETKTALTILDEDGYHWGDEYLIFLESIEKVYDYGKENIIFEHTISSINILLRIQ